MLFRSRRDALLQCDLFVAPSRLEGFGLAAAEAMAMGLPIVLSDAPGLSTLIQDRLSGRVCDFNNHEHVAHVLYNCLRNDDSLQSYGACAAATARDRFDPLVRRITLNSAIFSLLKQ